MGRVPRVSLGFLAILLVSTSAWAQATAQINGSVVDTSGAVLPGVTVVAVQTDTGIRREVVSDENGSFGLLNLPTGPYRLEASLAGFRSFAQTGIVLQVNSNPVIKVTLQLGELAETVQVVGAAPLVETRSRSSHREREDRGAPARRAQPNRVDYAGWCCRRHRGTHQPEHDLEPRDLNRRWTGLRCGVPA
jgi:hypothetical protein